MHRATPQIMITKGKQMRTSRVVRSNSSGLSAKPGAMRKVRGPAQYFHDHGQHAQNQTEPDQGGAGHGLSCLLPLLFAHPREHGDEGHGQRAFAEQPAQQVGNTEGHEKGVRGKPRAQGKSHDHVAHETEHARDQRGPGNHHGIAGHAPGMVLFGGGARPGHNGLLFFLHAGVVPALIRICVVE